MSSFCPHCGSPITDQDKFCPSCGGSLAELRKAQQPASTQPAAPAQPITQPAPMPAMQPIPQPAPQMQPQNVMQGAVVPPMQPQPAQPAPVQDNGLEEGEIAYDMNLAAQFGVKQPSFPMPVNPVPNRTMPGNVMPGMPAPNPGMPVNPAVNPAMPFGAAPANAMPPQMGMAQPYGGVQMPYPQAKKHSNLSRLAGIFSFIAAPVSLIIAILDLAKKDETEKHTLSIAALVIDLFKVVFWIVAFVSSM